MAGARSGAPAARGRGGGGSARRLPPHLQRVAAQGPTGGDLAQVGATLDPLAVCGRHRGRSGAAGQAAHRLRAPGQDAPFRPAEILEELAPAEREAVFTSLDEEVAAETLEEVDPKLQKALLEKLDEERIADIVEEMDPGAAADLLAELPEDRSDAILEEMEPEERQEVEELLEFDEHSAAGYMTTEFVHLDMAATVAKAVRTLRDFDGDPESVTEVYLLDEKNVLRGAIPLSRLVMAQPYTRLAVLAEPRVLSCPADMNRNELAEMFDKYNLRALPVVDAEGRMVGVVQSDQVISFLREQI